MSEAKLRDYLNRVTADLRRTRDELARAREPVAIIGMACRYPGGVRTPDQLWRLVSDGVDAITEAPAERGWDTRPRGGFLHDIDRFDAAFFGISPREALAMDPQQRLLLETAWEALEHTGITPESLHGSDTGTFIGTCAQDYSALLRAAADDVAGYFGVGTAASVMSGRLAYVLGLQGPAVTVDTACSASLVALHNAVRSLRARECSLAITGGVAVMTTPEEFEDFDEQGGLAPDGRCKSFSDDADGTTWSEGVGVLVLERLSDARRNGHRVLAVVRGTAINSDGASNGLTAPSGPAQQHVIWQALGDAGLSTSDIDAVEAHGTGTKLGDPIEAQALLATYGQDREQPLLLGSLKSNIGHAQAAAGVGGVIKMVQAMRHGELPRTLHAQTPTSAVDWSTGAVTLLTEPAPWPRSDRPRRAGVSSFGVSGTNAHVILESAEDEVGTAVEGPVALVLSARTEEALREQADQLADHLEAHPEISLADAGFTLAGRTRFEHRAALVASDRSGLRSELVQGRVTGSVKPVFVFPGQGSHWAGMATALIEDSQVFADAMAEWEDILRAEAGWSLRQMLDDEEALRRADVVQPVLLAVMVSLTALWRAHGVEPAAVVGHSLGEYAAACVAGALSAEDAARAVVRRSRLIADVLSGASGVVAVPAAPEAITVGEIAAYNGPHATVVAGDEATLNTVLAQFPGAKRIPMDYASHSSQVEPVRERLIEDLSAIAAKPGDVPFYSTVTGELFDTTGLDSQYWYDNLRQPVRFEPAVRALRDAGHTVFLEISPHPLLLSGIEEITSCGTLRRGDGGLERFLRSLATAHVHGVDVDWAPVFAGAVFADLPTYPFQGERFWPRPAAITAPGFDATGHPLLSAAVELPEAGGHLFTGTLSLRAQPWLADHVIQGKVVLPGTAFLEMALHTGGRVEDLVLEAPLVLPESGEVRVQVVLGAEEDGTRPLSLFANTNGTWTRHATGTVSTGQAELEGFGAWPETGAVEGFYDQLWQAGFHYGPTFQGLRSLVRDGDDVYAEVALPQGEAGDFGVHPALLDAVQHAADLTGVPKGLPFSWKGVSLHSRGASVVRARLRRTGENSVSLSVVDSVGLPVLSVESLTLLPAAAAQEPLFRLTWMPVEPVRPVVPAAVEAVEIEVPDGDVVANAHGVTARVLELVQSDKPLVLVTRDQDVDPVAATVHGLVRTAQSELPDRFVLLDSDEPGLPDQATLDRVLACDEPRLALRGGALLAARLVPVQGLRAPTEGPWRLETTQPGSLADLALIDWPAAAEPLAPGHVRLEVRAAGVNFRDVFDALGMNRREATPMGSEAAGVVLEVGAGVTGLRPGDRVFGMCDGSFGPVAVTDHRLLARMPEDWSFTEAATVPLVFLTALYGLRDLARLQPGESLLVHAGTGGVGMAAIQLAQHWGAEVYATASEPKQHMLKSLGIPDHRIASSRTLDFERKFPVVDVVLNSLTGEFVDASLRLLSSGGRFMEMGKTDIRSAVPDVEYRAFDLGELDEDEVRERLAELLELFESGALKPLPATTWDVRRAQEAFGFISQAKHIGKVVLTIPRGLGPASRVLITGATGGVGRLVAHHLVARHGVRDLLLVSRSGGGQDLAEELTALGARVELAACEVGDRAAVERLLHGREVTAVFHAAGVVDDGTIDSLTPERLSKVLRPKVDAAWHLHELTAHMDLTEFVLFSSGSGIVGNPGQANYAAANTFLDALARHRRARGLPATSIAWGLWAIDAGMAHALTRRDLDRIAATGLPALSADQGLALLDAVLTVDEPNVAALRVDLAALRGQRDVPHVLRALAPSARREAVQDLLPRIATLGEEDRLAAVLSVVSRETAAVLGHHSADRLGADEPFKDLGFDSLTAVDLRNRLNTLTGLRLAPTVIFDHPTPSALARHVAALLAPAPAEPAVLTELARLEAAVAGFDGDADTLAEVRRRLTALLDRPATATADIGAASDEEMFDLLSKEFGIS
ncbi:polyketide synthase 12 [Allokutzneria albata]|uniref:Polyketide synthase 12 n=1 Tax=Allokutzneria albata TaxID=211114 RepID=A0A1G9S6T1_ALLAB|nr:type I polyketide synthase [Allokutzneria albata]SDM31213.1 polyketide synthase 12 [Allokutzneria albata]